MAETSTVLTLPLSKTEERHLQERVAAGHSASIDDYVRGLIRLDRALAKERAALLRKIDVGLEDLRQGRYKTYSSVEDLANDVKRRGRERLKRIAKRS